jgi:hypothetical protein
LFLAPRKKADSELAGLMRRHWVYLYLDPLYLDTVTGDPERQIEPESLLVLPPRKRLRVD